ncbi:BTAD domain-containing putative transcriptional regulator [Actinoplanes sp. NPDC051470]|uniref:BTAD domain-containing putative transcriptional regulator n=1 Tax=Actinoplanes sp. NPDC051470 TaxID=3157224 RepID=UPI00342FAB58
MALTVHLLGAPSVERSDGVTYQVRSRKSWALLACLILSERPPARERLAGLLYPDADDPMRALRWGLTEIRRCLGVAVDGDPVVLRLPPEAVVDVDVLTHGSWSAAATLPGLGADLLEGVAVRGAPVFESWLLSERRRVAAASEAMLHEAALGRLAGGDLTGARDLAVRAAAMSPLDENHQALLIRLYRLAGDDAAAEKQHRAVTELFATELGVRPGIAVDEALRESRQDRDPAADVASIEAVMEAGAAAVAAGAVDTGVRSLRTAVRLADRARPEPVRLRVVARLRLAEALIHSLRGMDEHLAAGDVATAAAVLEQAFARACRLGDPCWEGMSARSLALVADARGEQDRPFELLADARTRSTRLADPYVWLEAHILDAQCDLGLRHGHPDTARWVDTLRRLSSRTGMREMTVRALRHSAALGNTADGEAASLLSRRSG